MNDPPFVSGKKSCALKALSMANTTENIRQGHFRMTFCGYAVLYQNSRNCNKNKNVKLVV